MAASFEINPCVRQVNSNGFFISKYLEDNMVRLCYQFCLITLLLLLFPFAAGSQGYFPLQVGNLWEYWEVPPPDIFAGRIRANNDTLMPNGMTYSCFKSDPFWNDEYFRQAGTKVYGYDTYLEREDLLFDFSKAEGDTVTVRYYPNDTVIVTLAYDRIRNVFGEQRRCWDFSEQSTQFSMFIVRRVADSIGIVYFVYEPGLDYYLHGAIVNGTKPLLSNY